MDVASTVECYMKEHGMTREVAEAKITEMAEGGWKSMNQMRFKHRASLLPFVQRIANLCMSATLLYHGRKNGFSNSQELKDMFESHFVNPIPLNHLDYNSRRV